VTGTPGAGDPDIRPFTPSGSSAEASSLQAATPSPKSADTASNVCPILGGGGSGCQSTPAWLIQQRAETGYSGIVALLAGVILTLAGIAGLILRRRRSHTLS
jgi:LPXTG-motif cell wall-anchored protein